MGLGGLDLGLGLDNLAIDEVFLAPTGAQGVKMCVRACVRSAHYAQKGSRRVLEGAKGVIEGEL